MFATKDLDSFFRIFQDYQISLLHFRCLQIFRIFASFFDKSAQFLRNSRKEAVFVFCRNILKVRTDLLWCRVLNVRPHPPPFLRSGRGLATHVNSNGLGFDRFFSKAQYSSPQSHRSKWGLLVSPEATGGLRRTVCVENRRQNGEAKGFALGGCSPGVLLCSARGCELQRNPQNV